MVIERFAPSPTGLLHLGHAFSAHVAWSAARRAGGRFLLRMEDLDPLRARSSHCAAIVEDLAWLGLDWDGPPFHQSGRRAAYEAALERLSANGLTYACACSRRDILEAASAPQEGASHGPDGPVYPGTCRARGLAAGPGRAIRLDVCRAIDRLGGAAAVDALDFREIGLGIGGESGRVFLDAATLVRDVGDVVLAGKGGTAAYDLAVTLDDAHQGVNHVTRGRDLFPATQIHRVLQALLDLPAPIYRHHALVRDEVGKRLAKRDDARAIARYRAEGMSPADVLALAALNAGPSG